jgi:crotonobetainyl-CoA:carnitine CoA-transferase CaiB-like acyl-CoA transferase
MQAPWKFSATPASVKMPGPKLGEHNYYIFGKLLGLSKVEVDRLEKEEIAY